MCSFNIYTGSGHVYLYTRGFNSKTLPIFMSVCVFFLCGNYSPFDNWFEYVMVARLILHVHGTIIFKTHTHTNTNANTNIYELRINSIRILEYTYTMHQSCSRSKKAVRLFLDEPSWFRFNIKRTKKESFCPIGHFFRNICCVAFWSEIANFWAVQCEKIKICGYIWFTSSTFMIYKVIFINWLLFRPKAKSQKIKKFVSVRPQTGKKTSSTRHLL